MAIEYLYSSVSKIRNRHFFALDFFAFLIIPFIALFIRTDWNVSLAQYSYGIYSTVILFMLIKISLFISLGLYKRYWQYASIDEVIRLIIISCFVLLVQSVVFYIFHYAKLFEIYEVPLSLPIIDGLLSIMFIGLTRLSLRIVERLKERFFLHNNSERILIVGAGKAGLSIVQEMQRNPQLGYTPVGFIDDDKTKMGMKIRGIPVIGGRTKIKHAIKDYNADKVLIAMPTASGEEIREIVSICKKIGIKTQIIPGIFELLGENVRIENIREVLIEDLLRRDVVNIESEVVNHLIKNKKVLVTGAGGSIGSELCRQILKFKPQQLILLGHGENSVFEIEQELNSRIKTSPVDGLITEIKTVIADIRFQDRIEVVFERYKPEIVFHAAAHKHVPIMEHNFVEAISNNVLGTKILVESAVRNSVKNFVLISTDKAVNPTSIMGASKRIAELIVLNYAKNFENNYVAVRFGNVLGSRGSVIHTFRNQIKEGGPVTITHPDITRYFMTIPEAVQLVLQSSVLGEGGEIFVLDMGKPVKVYDLACDMIKLSGYEVNKDIKIEITGLRPGEKLFEELIIKGENYDKTTNEKIMILKNNSKVTFENLNTLIEDLIERANYCTKHELMYLMKKIVKEYEPMEFRNDFSKITY